MHSIRPNDSLHATEHGVEDNGYGGGNDDRHHIPSHQYMHRHSQQIKDATHTRNLRQQVAGRGVETRPASEFLFKEGISRDAATMTVKGYEIFCGEIAGHGDRQRENEGIPV